jgi:histidyl-tRNA synthetase
MPLIQPRTLRGFRDFLPDTMLVRERIIDVTRDVYRSFGFAPIDTPALEYEEILLGKGGTETDKQMYRFEDHGGRRVGMRFDLTVPLARFAAQHIPQLGTPLKRYQIATVWRGENTQRGRYREFVQCDFDTIGTQALTADIESVLVIHDLMRAIGFEDFVIRVNNRRVLSGLLDRLQLTAQVNEVLRAIDKLPKLGREKVAGELRTSARASAAQVDDVLKLTELAGSDEEVLADVTALVAGNEAGEQGVAELRQLLAATAAAGVDPAHLQLDVAIARGLDYYTGMVFETFLGALPGIGSVCSGGRYDNLAELYTSQQLPGVGASLGLDRLLAAMDELGMLSTVATPAPVFIPFFAADRLHDYLQLAARLRAAGIGVEVFHEPKKLGQQLKYADRRGHRLAVIVGSDEFSAGTCQLKNLASGQAQHLPLETDAASLIGAIHDILLSQSN